MGHRIERADAKPVIVGNHYLSSFPSGWTYCYEHEGAVVVYAIPANKNLGPFLFGARHRVLELSRLWAPDGHAPNLLSGAVAASAAALRQDTQVDALVSFADPNQGHHGGIYQAASWLYTGQSSETRVYRLADGRTVSRRSFHSGSTSLPPSVKPVSLPGKHRYVRPLNRHARRDLRQPVLPYPKVSAVTSATGC